MFRKALAEFIGTLALVFFGAGAAMTNGFGIGLVGVALAFGLVIVAMAYSVGAVSGGHFNPAVSFAMLLDGRIKGAQFLEYIFAQFAGALVGAWLLHLLFGRLGNLGTNSFGAGRSLNLSAGQAFLLELLLTFFFVLCVLGVTAKAHRNAAVAGIVIGLALTLVHLIGLPLTGTSVNPARSFGPALLFGGTPWHQLWLFILAPLVGGALAAGVWRLLSHHAHHGHGHVVPVGPDGGYAPSAYVEEVEYVPAPQQVTVLREVRTDGGYPDIAG